MFFFRLIMKIIFICTGNIVRSYMAERVLKKKLIEKNRSDIDVSSASIFNMNGEIGDSKAAKILEEMGFDSHDHKSRLLTHDMADEADMIVVMEQYHKDTIIGTCPDTKDKVFFLKPFSRGCEQLVNNDVEEIKDPHNLSAYHYRLCFAEIYLSVEGLLKCI